MKIAAAPGIPMPAAIPRYRRWPAVLGSAAAVLFVAVASCEVLGWPFLADPLQRWLSGTLQRRVSMAIDGHTPASVVVRLIGGLRIEAPQIEIAAPAWSPRRRMMRARDAVMSLRYADLWRAHRGAPLRIHLLQAADLQADIERLADGRASWQFGPPGVPAESGALRLPLFDRLKVVGGTLNLRDDMTGLRFTAQFRSGANGPAGSTRAGLVVDASGSWHGEPLRVALRSTAVLPWVNSDASAGTVPVQIDALLADTHLALQGRASDVLGLGHFDGRFNLRGASLATLARSLGMAPPPRAPFSAIGSLARAGQAWRITVQGFHLGGSDLNGQFTLDPSQVPARLRGHVGGARLNLFDLARPPAASAGHVLRGRFVQPAWRALDVDLRIDVPRSQRTQDGDASGPLHAGWRVARGQWEWREADNPAPRR